jgi:hypothetical protein
MRYEAHNLPSAGEPNPNLAPEQAGNILLDAFKPKASMLLDPMSMFHLLKA